MKVKLEKKKLQRFMQYIFFTYITIFESQEFYFKASIYIVFNKGWT